MAMGLHTTSLSLLLLIPCLFILPFLPLSVYFLSLSFTLSLIYVVLVRTLFISSDVIPKRFNPVGPSHPPTQWVPGALSLGLKRPGREADHSPPFSTEVKKNAWIYTSTPLIPLHGVVLN
jgi:hypothetical protein